MTGFSWDSIRLHPAHILPLNPGTATAVGAAATAKVQRTVAAIALVPKTNLAAARARYETSKVQT